MSSPVWFESRFLSPSEDTYGSFVASGHQVYPLELPTYFHEEGQYAEAPTSASLERGWFWQEPRRHSASWAVPYEYSGPQFHEHGVLSADEIDEMIFSLIHGPHCYNASLDVQISVFEVPTDPFSFVDWNSNSPQEPLDPSSTWPSSTGCQSLGEPSHGNPLMRACDYDVAHPPLLSCAAVGCAHTTIDDPPG